MPEVEQPRPPVIWAAFVTYAAPELAERCIAALLQQEWFLDKILVIDNGPSEVPLEVKANHRLELDTVGSNVGPAGGFARALDRFRASEADLLWIMDDDVIPAPDCLRRQVDAYTATSAPSFVVPETCDETGVRREQYGWVAVLIDKPAVLKAGLPVAEYFWGSEDIEWMNYRLREQHGYARLVAPGAVASFDSRPADRRSPPWKYYYEARNGLHSNLYRRPALSLLVRLKIILVRNQTLVARAWCEPAGSGLALWMIARGILDGLLARLGIRVAPTTSDRSEAKHAVRGDPPGSDGGS